MPAGGTLRNQQLPDPKDQSGGHLERKRRHDEAAADAQRPMLL
jgi:hypothetical protein